MRTERLHLPIVSEITLFLMYLFLTIGLAVLLFFAVLGAWGRR